MPLLLVSTLLAVASIAVPVAGQQGILAPRVVMQSDDSAGAEVAAWYGNDAYLITANGDHRQILIWDVASGYLIDKLRIPARTGIPEDLILDSMTVSGRKVTIEARAEWLKDAMSLRAGRTIEFDLVDRVVTVRNAPGKATVIPDDQPTLSADRMAAIQKAGTSPLTRAEKEAIAALPLLPPSSNGKQTLERSDLGGVRVMDAGGKILRTLYADSQDTIDWVSLNPGGSLLGFLSGNKVEILRSDRGGYVPDADFAEIIKTIVPKSKTAAALGKEYGRIGWIDDTSYLASATSSPEGREGNGEKGSPQPALVVDATLGIGTAHLPPRCYSQPLNARQIVGAGLANCRQAAGSDRSVALYDVPDGTWRTIYTPGPAEHYIDALRAAPSGRAIALSVYDSSAGSALVVIDGASGKELHRLPLPESGEILSLNFTPDSKAILYVADEAAFVWRLGESKPRALPIQSYNPDMITSDGRSVLMSGILDQKIQRADLVTGKALPSLDMPNAIAGGFIPGKSIFWAASVWEGLKLFETRSWKPILTISRFVYEDQTYSLSHAPDGRYDTNLPPDTDTFRWLMADAPFQSLAAQTFMRDYFTPNLAETLIACTQANSCDRLLPPIPPVTGLNRSLPVVKITAVRTVGPALVDIDVEASEGVNSLPSGTYGQATSGVHNLRLFRNETLVAELGQAGPNLDSSDRAGWREQTRLPLPASGILKHSFRAVKLPTGPSKDPISFSAYAFNDDRVKGETAFAEHKPQPTRAAPRKLYLLSIGINAYPGGTFRPLRYAVPDAEAIRQAMRMAKRAPGDSRPIEVVPIVITGTAANPATRARIREGFARLSAATPDDSVLISYSGHGYTDSKGRFSLVPSDVRTEGDTPVRESLITAGDLTAWLSGIDSDDMNFIIDACHSAASVDSEGFKPGPMGDPGLGQLAYDKGIRILAASAPDQYAMEDTTLGHGLLTYALVVEGIGERKADFDGDGIISFEDLTSYALDRLPALSAPSLASADDGPGLLVEWEGGAIARQQPSFFDFTSGYSKLQLAVGSPSP